MTRLLLLSLLAVSPAYAGPQTVPLNNAPQYTFYASNLVTVTWGPGRPKVVIPASQFDATDFFEIEMTPPGRFDGTTWRFAFQPDSRIATPWSELILLPHSHIVRAVVNEGSGASIYTLVRGETYGGTHAYDLRIDPVYRLECTGSACATSTP